LEYTPGPVSKVDTLAGLRFKGRLEAMEVEVSFYGHLRRLAGGRTRTIEIGSNHPTVGDLRTAIAVAIPAIAPHLPQSSVGMGVELISDEAPLLTGAEISLLPPVSGGGRQIKAGAESSSSENRPRIQEAPLSLDALLEETGAVDAGALVVFGGSVRARDRGVGIAALDYDVHWEMAEGAIRRIEADLATRDGVLSCRIVHRVGEVRAGEMSVYVVVRARHRPEAFSAARDGIERVKAEVAIWKEDIYSEGDESRRG
jgi:molybdopterin synthase catalytic subunit